MISPLRRADFFLSTHQPCVLYFTLQTVAKLFFPLMYSLKKKKDI